MRDVKSKERGAADNCDSYLNKKKQNNVKIKMKNLLIIIVITEYNANNNEAKRYNKQLIYI